MSKHNIGIYLRLSIKDRGCDGDSNSIQVQNEIINKFIENSEDLKSSNKFIFCDDGYSGVSFQRPEAMRLLEDVKNGKINCIIVKDISRFGRNYIEVGNYLEKVFPFLGVRFIAVSDDYDSDKPDCIGDLISAFKSIFADIYSKELSVKVKKAQENYARQGKYTGGTIPYGYEQSKSDKHKFVIDEDAATIVRWIFSECINGKEMANIARELNAKNIPSRAIYLGSKGRNFAVSSQKISVWSTKSVDRVLRNQAYIGNYVYFATSHIKIGGKKVKKNPKEDWIVCENAHEPIISKDVFEAVNSRKISRPRSQGYEKNILATLVTCGVCNHRLRLIKNNLKPYFDCETSKFTDKLSCKDTKLYVSTIHDIALKSIKVMAKSAVSRKNLAKSSPLQSKIGSLKLKHKNLEVELARWVNRYKELFQNKVDYKISTDVFNEESAICTNKRRSLTVEVFELQKEIEALETQIEFDTSFIDCYSQFTNLNELTDDVLKLLIKEVFVYDNENIEIKWNFAEVLE